MLQRGIRHTDDTAIAYKISRCRARAQSYLRSPCPVRRTRSVVARFTVEDRDEPAQISPKVPISSPGW